MNLEVAYMKWYLNYNSPKYPKKKITFLDFIPKNLQHIWISFQKVENRKKFFFLQSSQFFPTFILSKI